MTARKVFLSHTAEFRHFPTPRSFEDAIKRAGDVVVDMAYFTAHDQPPAKVCQNAVSVADVYVLIAGSQYGSPVRDRGELSYTELEFDAATESGVPRLVFMLSDDAVGPAAM